MPQHVRMDAEWHPSNLSQPGEHPAEGNGGHRGTALAHEHIARTLLLAFSVGMNITVTIVNVLMGLIAIALMAKTLSFKKLRHASRAEQEQQPAA